jgi:hypothetical protein
MIIRTGRRLNKFYRLGAAHALYREKGDWYHALLRFPGVLFDAEGCLIFQTEQDYKACRDLKKGPNPNHIHAEGGIKTLPGYKRLDPPPLQVD